MTSDEETLENVSVELNGGMNNMMLTDAAGHFEFTDVPQGGDYTVTPLKNDDPLNGVTTLDLVKINRHILGTEKQLISPYKLIAADANNSKAVTTLDLVELRKLILYINDEFSNNSSWRFVDNAYEFPNPLNPWEEEFPEVIGFNNLVDDETNVDFVAIKIGDINGNASTNGLLAADDRNFEGELRLKTANQKVEAGKSYDVPVRVSDFQMIHGFQFSLEFDKEALQILSVSNAGLVNSDHFGFAKVDEGVLTNSWNANNALTLEKDEELFVLKLKALKDGTLSDLMQIGSSYTTAEAYRQGAQMTLNCCHLIYSLSKRWMKVLLYIKTSRILLLKRPKSVLKFQLKIK